MWKWHCPQEPLLVFEHHNKAYALQSIALHVLVGYAPLGIPTCTLIHELMDNGEECFVEDCSIPYIRD